MHLFFSRLFAPRARAPEGEIIYAIGDIHGRDDLLGRLHDAIGRDLTAAAGARKATVVYLGDYVDRGPSSRAVLDRLIAPPVAAAESVFLKGNHEDAPPSLPDGEGGGELEHRPLQIGRDHV